jgi:hypothetical protein
LYIDTKFISEHSELWNHINRHEFEQFFIKACKKLSKNVPLPIFVSDIHIDFTENNGETRETIQNIELKLYKFINSSVNLNKLKQYSIANGLTHFVYKHHPDSDVKKSIFYYKYFKGVSQ